MCMVCIPCAFEKVIMFGSCCLELPRVSSRREFADCMRVTSSPIKPQLTGAPFKCEFSQELARNRELDGNLHRVCVEIGKFI